MTIPKSRLTFFPVLGEVFARSTPKNESISIFDVNEGYTNIFINVYKLLKLI